MPTDKREMLLNHMFTLIQQVPGFVSYYRNRGEVSLYGEPTELYPQGVPQLPAIFLLDGREVPIIPVSRGRSHGMPPGSTILEIQCQVFIILMPRENQENDTVGQELNSLRMALCKKILKDETLAALCGNNGEVEYRGCETDLQTGSSIEGQMQLDFSLQYLFTTTAL